ncbi:MAG: hypothetical protein LBL66_04305 [Clostridiales bacterium]|jgi:hypothetical protein|nr:hypothetical protein [Clostridiales bacterium]
MKSVKKGIALLLALAVALGALAACVNGGKKYYDYYTFDTSGIPAEMLMGKTVGVEPVVRNLGEAVENPRYSVVISSDGEDRTADCYDAEAKTFTPDAVGDYAVKFTALDADGRASKGENGEEFTKTADIAVVTMGFAPINSAGADVTTVEESGVTKLVFGSSYASAKVNSNQYKVTGVTFKGDYRITYKIEAVDYAAADVDGIYFGVERQSDDRYDDSIKLNFGGGDFSAYFWNAGGGSFGDGWKPSPVQGWADTVQSATGGFGVEKNATHYVTFSRHLDAAKEKAYYAIEYDNVPFVGMYIGGNFTDYIKNVWVQSIGVACKVSVYEYDEIAPYAAEPGLTLSYDAATLGESFDLASGVRLDKDAFNYQGLYPIGYSVKDPSGAAAAVADKKFTPAVAGEYDVTVRATNFGGFSTVRDAKLRVGSSFGVPMENAYEKGEPIHVTPVYSQGATETEKESVTLEILKGGVASGIVPTGDGKAGFTFRVGEGGQYTAKFTMKGAYGNTVVREYVFGVAEPDVPAPVVSFAGNTAVSKTNLGVILDYSVSDETDGDCTKNAVVRVWRGEDKTGDEVTDSVIFDKANATANKATTNTENYPTDPEYFTRAGDMVYKIFRPNAPGKYYIEVGYVNSLGAAGAASHIVNVSNGTNEVYGYSLEGSKNLDKIAVGKDGTVIFDAGIDGTGNATLTRGDLGAAMFAGSWEMSYYLTDLAYGAQGKFMTTLYLAKSDDPAAALIWDDVAVGGNMNNDLWGFEANIYGTGWTTYEWRGVWQDETDAFKHPGAPEKDRLGTEYNDNGFREAPGYVQYGFGTHKYTVRYVVAADTGAVTVGYYIDDVAEARHETAAAHNKYSVLTGVKLFSERQMSGIMTGLTFKDLP